MTKFESFSTEDDKGDLKSAAEIAMEKTQSVADEHNRKQERNNPNRLRSSVEIAMEKSNGLMRGEEEVSTPGMTEETATTPVHEIPVEFQETSPETIKVKQERMETGDERADSKTFEQVGRERMERVTARVGAMKDTVGGFMKSIWEKAKDLSLKTKDTVAGGAKKVFYTGLAAPEIARATKEAVVETGRGVVATGKEYLKNDWRRTKEDVLDSAAIVTGKIEDSGAYVGEKYSLAVEACKNKYQEIAEKALNAKRTFIERVDAARERQRQRRENIATAKAQIAHARSLLRTARGQLAKAYLI